jgi:mono/diheme cytochrome c family protein
MPHDIRSVRAALVGAGLAAALAGALPVALHAQDSAAATVRTSADSSFTVEQAERGEKVFSRSCLECHERLEMANNDFRLKWGGQTTFDLFKNIATTMPDSDPGILPRAEYVDVVAYILKLNGVPTGTVELAEDSTAMSQAKLHLPPAPANDLAARQRAATGRALAVVRSRLAHPPRPIHQPGQRPATVR